MFGIICHFRCRCAITAWIVGLLFGILAAFLQITGTIAITAQAVAAALGLAAVYLGLLLLSTAIAGRAHYAQCVCSALNTLFWGIPGILLAAAVLFAVGIAATGILPALLTGALVFFLSLIAAGTACYIRSLAGCSTVCRGE